MKPGDLVWIDVSEKRTHSTNLWKERSLDGTETSGELAHGEVGMLLEFDDRPGDFGHFDLCLFGDRYGYVNRMWLRPIGELT